MANAKLKDKQQILPWSQQFIALTFLAIIGTVIVYFVPKIPNSYFSLLHKTTSITSHGIIAMFLLSAITIIFLSYYRTKAGFSTKWLVAATVYNVLILLIKFTLSSNEISRGSNSIYTIVTTALVVACLYIIGLIVLFLLFEGKLISKSMHKKLITTSDGKLLLSVYMFVFIMIVRDVIYHLPGLKNTEAASYLGDVFKPRTYLLSALIFLITFSVVQAFGQVRRKQDLKSFFVVAVSLILIFHLWWGIYMYKVTG